MKDAQGFRARHISEAARDGIARGRIEMPRLANRNQCRQCITDTWQPQDGEKTLRQCGKFKWQRNDVRPSFTSVAEPPRQGAHCQDWDRESAVLAVARN